MPVTLSPYALLTVEEATLSLKVGASTADVEMVTRLVNTATEFCEWFCGRALAAREFEDLRFPAQTCQQLRPRATPIDVESPIEIALDGTALTVWAEETHGDPALKDVIVRADDPGVPSYFWREAGWLGGSSRNPDPIRVTYTGGFLTVPEHIKDAARLVLGTLYNEQEKKIADVQSFGQGPVNPSVTFLGLRPPMRAKEILYSYRTDLAA